ncbi:MAG: Sulfate adenylyltransferase [Ignavibacteria bacterium]|nr:Sulfate adenylyltransferase [Ignavibacteria bacterium]
MESQKLISPHGSKELMPLLLSGSALEEEKKKASTLKQISISSREAGDLIMMASGGFTPLTGFMNRDDWKSVCEDMKMLSKDGLFWPIPITLSTDKTIASGIKTGEEIALYSEEFGEILGTMKIEEKYSINKELECDSVFQTTEPEHPGVRMVLEQGEVNLAGPVKALSEGYFPTKFQGVYLRPEESRRIFSEHGWKTIAALQLRNPMHRSHEFLAKIALEVSDGLFIHQLIGKLKPGDIPAYVRVRCIDTLVEEYFVKDSVVQGGYPLDMRYAGPREALLHALFRQNYGCSHLIVGRDHAGVSNYYGPFDSQDIFDELPEGALLCKPLKIDWTFWCYKCGGMASMKTCPHSKEHRLLLSGTVLRMSLLESGTVPVEFSRPEVLKILREYYAGLEGRI